MAILHRNLKEWLKKKNDEFLKKLLEVGKAEATKYFGTAATITIDKTDTGYALTARGEAICFIEFGTGVYAEASDDEFANFMPFKIEAGSWSESELGAGTWGDWLAKGNSPETYPYNRQATHGMWEAYKAIKANANRIAKEVYK